MEVAARELAVNEIEPASIEAGSQIGSYKILEQIARGGMGVVYRAEQQYPVRRIVALKVIKPGMDSEQVIARFQAERQALALMDHPNIARVLDAGTTSAGRLYFVMELVDGLPITEYCQRHELSLRERLALFIPVCQAIQHAHQKGVIHRDIKPSNILVTVYDGKPVPKVIDFGIAKAMQEPLTERSMHTQAGAVIGTLEYMSPEQAGSFGEDIDTRTDVYSLGIILYELLAGAPPRDLRGMAFDEFLRRLREDDPPKPSTRLRRLDPAASMEVARERHTEPRALAKQIRGDLDSIVLKALEKDRSRRYGSPSDLAADIGRYLRNEAVQAVAPSVAYRARKFASRHWRASRGPLAAMLAAVLLLAAPWASPGSGIDEAIIGRVDHSLYRVFRRSKRTGFFAGWEPRGLHLGRGRQPSPLCQSGGRCEPNRADLRRCGRQLPQVVARWEMDRLPAVGGWPGKHRGHARRRRQYPRNI